MKILDISAGRRAVWFDKNHRDTTYVDVRPEVAPTFVADARALPAEVGADFDLIVFDPPHKNNAASGKMTHNYGHWTAEQIRDIVTGSAREAHRVARPDALMAFKWNDHSRKLHDVLTWISPWWEPLFGHGVSGQHRHKSMTSWVMLRRRGERMMRCYIFDIDGTIADLSHRLPHIQKTPKDWPSFFAACSDDAPIPHTIKLAIDVALAGATIVYVSGRSDECREATEAWLARHALPSGRVYMRKAGDHRPDHQVKVELLAALREDGHTPVMAFDDRNAVVKMWREIGVPCAQVAEGDF